MARSNSSEPVTRSANLCLVRGECSAPAEVRTLASGSRVATLGVRTRPARGRATSVPVSLWDPPGWVDELAPGDEVVVVGRVERRFYRAASGGAASRVELQAELLARGGDRRRVAAALRRAQQTLDVLAE